MLSKYEFKCEFTFQKFKQMTLIHNSKSCFMIQLPFEEKMEEESKGPQGEMARASRCDCLLIIGFVALRHTHAFSLT